MRKPEIINTLTLSGLDLTKVWVICGAAMVLHGLREQTSDIDIGCSSEYFAELLKKSGVITNWEGGMRAISLTDSIEIFEEWNIENHVIISGIKTSSIADLIRHKESLNREKDQADLRLLYQHGTGKSLNS